MAVKLQNITDNDMVIAPASITDVFLQRSFNRHISCIVGLLSYFME